MLSRDGHPPEQLMRLRIADLDALLAHGPPDDCPLPGAIEVLGQVTDTWFSDQPGTYPVLDPDVADGAASGSRLLMDLACEVPDVVTGPVDRHAQDWTVTSRNMPPGSVPVLDERLLQRGDAKAGSAASTKPFERGLFTATAVRGGPSMWRSYLDPYYGSDLFPLPWHTYRLEVRDGVDVLEISTAGQWVEFLQAYPRMRAGLVYPDWSRVACDHAAVHLALRAIVAIQGFSFPVAGSISAPSYWDVESTFWLRYVFSGATLIDVVT